MTSRILPQFELFAPQSIAQALECLGRYRDKAAVMAGGTDLLVRMKAGLSPKVVVSLSQIPDLDQIQFDPARGLTLGAMVTVKQLLEFPNMAELYPALYASALENGTPQTKTQATILGNILNASPAADCACAALALGGHLTLRGPKGERRVDLDDFWQGYKQTDREADELALALVIPPPGKSASAFKGLTRTRKDLAKINAACALALDGGICAKVRIAMGAVAPTTLRLTACEDALQGQPITPDLIDRAAALAGETIQPIDDVRSTAEYRRATASVLVAQVLTRALARLESSDNQGGKR
ncbi:MAG: FAD binding domain-containing protein [Desulfobacterales bacterium]|nr:FAD binding domain-containing protein [Desulfobacterales bacterium]